MKIQKLMKRHDINISFKSQGSIYQGLFNAKDKTPTLQKSGVYKNNCSNYNAFYIGETGRSLSARIKEHLNLKNNTSAVAEHLKQHGHKIDIQDNVKLLHTCNKSYKLTLLEHLEINKALNEENQHQCLNDQVTLKQTPIYTFLNSNIE